MLKIKEVWFQSTSSFLNKPTSSSSLIPIFKYDICIVIPMVILQQKHKSCTLYLSGEQLNHLYFYKKFDTVSHAWWGIRNCSNNFNSFSISASKECAMLLSYVLFLSHATHWLLKTEVDTYVTSNFIKLSSFKNRNCKESIVNCKNREEK